ncbi:MAG: phosphoenolpyruvate carboxykinase (GTP) [Candidatus Latescibacteria bacterium]|nr:phosphoenolpyruvate carboxykinase (GTP) [bacterium]MBD3423211.1 phosphoenolpyruvate carboxykinase (GTP) [Candidatus Latescibacterota bacterium]
MNNSTFRSLGSILDEDDITKLKKIENPEVHRFIDEYIRLCNPEKVTVYTDSEEDLQKTRDLAIEYHEEAELKVKGHTIHFDGYYDQARDKEKTRFLLPRGEDLGPEFNTIDREEGTREIRDIMRGIMKGHHLHIKFYCLGPTGSPFSIPCVQLTDSAYVAHSEDILYRQGYSEFLKLKPKDPFFKFVHSEGELEKAGLGLMVSSNISDRRIYIDLEDELVYTANTQYAGNTIGLKKLAMRLAIHRASREGWLTEHMLVMGVNGAGGRKTYLTGAFPSMCGKTSTAMVEGENIVGDDIAYLKNIGGETRAVNVEAGIFGIIDGINPDEDTIQWEAITSPQEIIFTNQLVTEDGENYWNGKPGEVPSEGHNHSGKWHPGKKDREGNQIKPSHKNARFTFRIDTLQNADSHIHTPEGVPVNGVIYGGRDSDTSVPVKEAFNWEHGIIMYGACLESETTAATLGKEGVRKFNPMSNLDFLSLPIGKYVSNNVEFGKQIDKPPSIFAVNYFLTDGEGRFLNDKNDKKIWLKWMDLRINGEAGAIEGPTGLLPTYKDIRKLVKEVLKRDYSLDDYNRQFRVRIPENLKKLDRMKKIFTERVTDTPDTVMRHIEEQRERLLKAREEYGDYILPESMKDRE